jgi:FKBP-type peptidyl-prolyl cis-trans isomerase FklB
MQQALTTFRANQQKKQQERQQAQAKQNKQEGEAFLAENKKKKGVTTLPSGLQYQVIRSGKGASPKASDTVVTHYHGTLINGKVFDSSVDRGQPATFPVARVIKGWTEALQKMKVGDKWKIYVPSQLAYGAAGAPPKIGPDSALIFDIELLEIKK